VPKNEYASRNLYDVWLPNLAPSEELVKAALSADTDQAWKTFARRYRAEMKKPENAHLLDTFAALSHHASFSMGCYCENEARCHRSILKQLFIERGASLTGD